jgi:hypothetical protein
VEGENRPTSEVYVRDDDSGFIKAGVHSAHSLFV